MRFNFQAMRCTICKLDYDASNFAVNTDKLRGRDNACTDCSSKVIIDPWAKKVVADCLYNDVKHGHAIDPQQYLTPSYVKAMFETSTGCYFCAEKPTRLDRLDPDIPYGYLNAITVCQPCKKHYRTMPKSLRVWASHGQLHSFGSWLINKAYEGRKKLKT